MELQSQEETCHGRKECGAGVRAQVERLRVQVGMARESRGMLRSVRGILRGVRSEGRVCGCSCNNVQIVFYYFICYYL